MIIQRIIDAIYGRRDPELTDDERVVLGVLGPRGGDSNWYAYTFAGVMQKTTLTRDAVRAACRSLAEKGLAAFERALWTEDGEMVGSGYRATEAGKALNARLGTEPTQ